MGQLETMLRAEYLVDAHSRLTKVQGQPFKVPRSERSRAVAFRDGEPDWEHEHHSIKLTKKDF
jgi:hypothetical protein